jgi:hypothetical protein
LRSGIDVLSVEEIEQAGTPGYRVAYTVATVDGATQSGLVTILNAESASYAANLLLTDVSDTDLNKVDIEAADTSQELVNAIELMQTFSILPELQLASDESQ